MRIRTYKVTQLAVAIGLTLTISGLGYVQVGAYTLSELERELPNGISSAEQWDAECRSRLQTNLGATFNSGGGGALRGLYNATSPSGIYGGETWLSPEDRGNTATPLQVMYGTSEVNLRINDVSFICGSGVQPDIAGLPGGRCRTNITSQMILDQTDRWVNRSNPASIDRPPIALGSGCMRPSKAEIRTRIDSVTIVEDVNVDNGAAVQGGLITGFSPRQIQQHSYNGSTRYWFANTIPITYSNPTNPLRENRKITIELRSRGIGRFPGGVYACGSTTMTSWNYDRCQPNTMRLSIVLSVQGQWSSRGNTTTGQRVVQVGHTVQWQHAVYKSGAGRGPTSARYEIHQTIDGGAPTNVTSTLRNPAQPLDLSRSVPSGEQQVFNESSSFTPQAGDIGRTICRYIVWDPSNHTDTDNALNTELNKACVRVAKSPFVSITGADFVTQSINASHATTSMIDDTRYGSWIEYAGIAPSSALDVATGATLARSTGVPSPTTPLTFANNPLGTSGNFGAYPTASTPNVGVGWGSATTSASSGAIGGLANKTITNVPASGYSIQQSDDVTNSVIIQSNGKVVIAGNIVYREGPYSDLATLPQVIIRARDIEIAPNVTRIDAWLIATNQSSSKISTCGWLSNPSDRYYSGLSIGTCNQHLVVNGPIQANHLWLRRTAGADGAVPESRRATGESLNGRADSIMWTSAQRSDSTIRTQSVKELPPRF